MFGEKVFYLLIMLIKIYIYCRGLRDKDLTREENGVKEGASK